MGYPKGETVGSLIKYLQDQLQRGNIVLDTPIYIDIYALSEEEAILKEHEDKLEYHIPDDCPVESLNFRVGVWQGFPEGQHGDINNQNTVAFSCYVKPDIAPSFLKD
jgi:hypothetical protein